MFAKYNIKNMKALTNLQKHKDVIMEQLKTVPFNTLFAENVVNQTVNGGIFVDNTEKPQVFYILHPYGMSLLLGKNRNRFDRGLYEYILNPYGNRTKIEWMQAYPDDWHILLKKMAKKNVKRHMPPIEIDIRANFRFNTDKYIESKQHYKDENIKILKTGTDDFENMTGSVIPKYFWNTPNDFINNGVGYSLYYQDSLASIAFSSVVNNHYLELGIETHENFRGKNFAYEVCSALLDYCLEKGLEPVWACRKSNTGSYRLAKKLGFEESLNIPYYKLNL